MVESRGSGSGTERFLSRSVSLCADARHDRIPTKWKHRFPAASVLNSAPSSAMKTPSLQRLPQFKETVR